MSELSSLSSYFVGNDLGLQIGMTITVDILILLEIILDFDIYTP